jgi:L-ascorbate metabolism protein UlaG (beta-lactamase superfamily)
MQIRLVRHATLLVDVHAQRLLIDPMLDPAGARDAIAGTPSPRSNPLVPLPMAAEEVVRDVDAVLITHLHVDHLDDTAVELLRERDLPVLCQPQDAGVLRGRGLSDVRPVEDVAELPGGLRIHRTGGRHGTGELAERLGPVSGFVVRATGEPTLYVAGDTVWCELVEQAIDRHRPDIVVVNAGGARFLQGPPITMTPADVLATAGAAGQAAVIAVHMDAINHCLTTRADLRRAVDERVSIPADGEVAWSSPAAP